MAALASRTYHYLTGTVPELAHLPLLSRLYRVARGTQVTISIHKDPLETLTEHVWETTISWRKIWSNLTNCKWTVSKGLTILPSTQNQTHLIQVTHPILQRLICVHHYTLNYIPTSPLRIAWVPVNPPSGSIDSGEEVINGIHRVRGYQFWPGHGSQLITGGVQTVLSTSDWWPGWLEGASPDTELRIHKHIGQIQCLEKWTAETTKHEPPQVAPSGVQTTWASI